MSPWRPFFFNRVITTEIPVIGTTPIEVKRKVVEPYNLKIRIRNHGHTPAHRNRVGNGCHDKNYAGVTLWQLLHNTALAGFFGLFPARLSRRRPAWNCLRRHWLPLALELRAGQLVFVRTFREQDFCAQRFKAVSAPKPVHYPNESVQTLDVP